MIARALFHNLGQTNWLDNITRDLLNSGTLIALADHGELGSILAADGVIASKSALLKQAA